MAVYGKKIILKIGKRIWLQCMMNSFLPGVIYFDISKTYRDNTLYQEYRPGIYIDKIKTKKMARVSTYLNFPRNTEEAFNFYKSVFGGKFSAGGIARFGDIPVSEGVPPIAENDKNLVMHIELPIVGGHLLMGTDAPVTMGFNVNFGNNVHINIEPDTRAETQKLFDALSAGGKVTMQLQDMFWGAFYGSCTDKFGVQWMFNCTEKLK
jgi:PhnB protein